MKHLIIKTFTAVFRNGKYFWQCRKCNKNEQNDTTPDTRGCPRTGFHMWVRLN
jgi:hypothetical protein